MQELIASGRTADVFALDHERILRRYRFAGDTAAEARVMDHVRGHGFPAPRVLDASGRDLVLERLHGPTLTGALADGTCTLDRGAEVIADLHRRLHTVPAMRSTDPGHAVLHRDLHPLNVMLTDAGPVLDARVPG